MHLHHRQLGFHSRNVTLCNFVVVTISTPDLATRFFFLPVLYFCSFFPSSSLFNLPIVILFTPRRQTNERTNEQMNKRTVTLLFSHRVHLLLTITNFLPFASFLFLLTLDRLRR
jgi:hypothetical protein